MRRIDRADSATKAQIEALTQAGLPEELYTRAKIHASSHVIVSTIQGDFWVYGLTDSGSGIYDIPFFFLKNVVGIRGEAYEKIRAASQACRGTDKRFQISIAQLKELLPTQLSQPEAPSFPPLPARQDTPSAPAPQRAEPASAPTPTSRKGTPSTPHPEVYDAYDRMQEEGAVQAARGQKHVAEAARVARERTERALKRPEDKLGDALSAFGLGKNRKKHTS